MLVGIQFTADQIANMAPDSSSATAGRKLANPKNWKTAGQSPEALWGECQGSALYQVRIERATLTIQCSCPSRKHPCKHGLGLLFLAVNIPSSVPESEQPEWLTDWLNKRIANSQRKEQKTTEKIPSISQKKKAQKRQEQVNKGIEQLDLWLNDLIRNGLGSLETQPATIWEQEAAQMVDAQAPGLALQLRVMAAIPNASSNWIEKLLTKMGKLALLTEAFQHIEQLDSSLQEDVRQLIGWNLKESEVVERGEHVIDNWLIVGQITEDIDRGRVQRTWLIGAKTRKTAFIMQYAFAESTFTEIYPLGVQQQATLVYWPGAAPQRALFHSRHEEVKPIQDRLPGAETITTFFDEISETLTRQPWQERSLCVLKEVIPVVDPSLNVWQIQDKDGQILHLSKGEHWKLLALSGGASVDIAGEWNGEKLLPLGVLAENKYYVF